ncbi:hypothetical protein M0R04_06385 [Candidatus Dojkabacteria bacterium]|jgi:hypothetical protein|nr:hypothetical protein [Candidatus Dojkabacteria bacterium]
MKLQTGYHYTSLENWRKIQKEGLVCYPINKEELAIHGLVNIQGIWIWTKPANEISHMGNLLWQLGTKGTSHLVHLKIKYDLTKILFTKDGRRVNLYHKGSIGNFKYHMGDQAIIYKENIPPKQIKLIKEFKLEKLLI